jgi:hypothetical protein
MTIQRQDYNIVTRNMIRVYALKWDELIQNRVKNFEQQ